MAPATKKLSEKDMIDTESKLIPLLENTPSDRIELRTGEKLVFQRPTISSKYKYQIWLNKKLKEVGLDPVADADSEFLFFFNVYGVVNGNTVKLFTPEGEEYPFDPREDVDYKFVFEKYVTEEIFNKGKSEEDFILDAVDKFAAWQNETAVSEEDIKNS